EERNGIRPSGELKVKHDDGARPSFVEADEGRESRGGKCAFEICRDGLSRFRIDRACGPGAVKEEGEMTRPPPGDRVLEFGHWAPPSRSLTLPKAECHVVHA